MPLEAAQITDADVPPVQPEGTPEGAPEGTGAELILGKFKTQEDLIAAYQELERGKGQEKKKEETPAPTEGAPTGTPEKAAEKAGLDLDSLTAEYEQNGALSDETYTKLETAGLTKDQVNRYIAGQVALASQVEGRIAESVGGRDVLDNVIQWAGANLSDEEAAAYETVRKTGNEAALTMMLQQFKARFEAAHGRVPQFIEGPNRPTVTGAKPISGADELVRLMSDPRYAAGDKAYHAEVDKRLAVSPMFGT
jgi:hypothetical protein